MNLASSARKKLGRIKCVVFDQWPYLRAMKSIPRYRKTHLACLEKLPSLPECRGSLYEIHMLCGHRDVDMGIWASWSILRFMDGMGRLYVHSDGSLTQEDASAWGRVVPGVVVIDRAVSDATVERELALRAPRLYAWRCSNWASAQLVDVHSFGETPTLLVMDSDVLTFSRPQEVMDALTDSVPRFAWCSDLRDAYSASPSVLREVTGLAMPPRLCAGFLVTPRLVIQDFIRLEEHLRRIDEDSRLSVGHFWSCQTYYGLLAAERQGSEALPESYSNILGKTDSGRVLRHYVGIPKVRFRYFTEGLPRIAAQGGITPS